MPMPDSPPPADDQAARADLPEAEQYLRSEAVRRGPRTVAAAHSEALSVVLAEYDRRSAELIELRGKLDTVLDGHAYDAAVQEIAVDDLAVRVMELSGLLRGMARRASNLRETLNVTLDLGGDDLAAAIRDLNATDEAGSVDLRDLARAGAAGAVPVGSPEWAERRSSATWWAQAAELHVENERLRARVAAVRALHAELRVDDEGYAGCVHCGGDYPCDTLQALGGSVGAAPLVPPKRPPTSEGGTC